MSDIEMIEFILEWADDNPHFDPSFVLDMEKKATQPGGLTERQSRALENIIDRWNIC